MKIDTILSVDIGTSFVKAGLYTGEGVCLCVHREKTTQSYRNGALVQEADDYIDKFVSVVRTLMVCAQAENASVKAVAFTGQMAGVVGVDSDLNAVTDWSGTVDSRQDLSMSSEADIAKVAAISGTNTPIFAKKLKWFEAQLGNDAGKVRKYIGIIGYVIAKISQAAVEDTVMQATNLAFTGIADMRKLSWSGELCRVFDIYTKQLPRVVHATQIVGHLSRSFAQACGLAQGTPIVAGAGDKIASCIGLGLVNPGGLADESSTVGAMTLCVDRYKPNDTDRSLEVIPGAERGQYYMMFYIAGSGVAVDWYIKTFACMEQQKADKECIDVHKLLESEAARVAVGSDNLMCVGLLGGRSLPFTPSIRGAWIGHSFSHTSAHFYRSLLEGIAFEYKRSVDVMRKEFSHLNIDKIHVLGGGGKSALWNSIKADIMKADYQTLERSDLTLLGTSIIGGSAIGMYKSISEGTKHAAKIKDTYKVDEANSEEYQEIYSTYIDVLEANSKIYEQLQKRRNK